MKPVLWLPIFVVAFALWFLARTRPLHQGAQKADPKIYVGLRDMVLHSSRDKLSIPKPSTSTEPWGALMDWGIDAGTATVVSMGDGTVSVYLSSAGGFFGGGQSHEAIRNAGKQMLDAAKQVQPLMRPATDYPLPQRGQVAFYVY